MKASKHFRSVAGPAIGFALMLIAANDAAAADTPIAPPSCAPGMQSPLPLGCVNFENLGNMVADPQDLNHGRVLAPANGARESAIVDDYEHNKTKSFDASKSATPSIVLPGAAAGSPP